MNKPWIVFEDGSEYGTKEFAISMGIAFACSAVLVGGLNLYWTWKDRRTLKKFRGTVDNLIPSE